MRTKKLNILKGIALVFLLLGAVGWFLPWAGYFLPWAEWPLWLESPNTEPHGIVLDSKANIYCGSKFYGRIQMYHPNGRFVRGYDTEGGVGRGSDFGFRINEKDQLCITVSGISKDNRGSVHCTKIYDGQGNLIHTERRESNERDYTHDMIDFAIDSSGNRYTFKGSLFPRIVKRSTSGQKSIIIGTPIWLWFIQAPFPAFAFGFISIFGLIFLCFKADAAKISVPTINLFFGVQRLPSPKKILLFTIGIIGIVILLGITILIASKTSIWLVLFGFFSFMITIVIIILLMLICRILINRRCTKLDPKTLKKFYSSSIITRYEARVTLRSLIDKDPVMQKIEKTSNKIALTCLLVWFVVWVLTICMVLYLDHISV